RAARAGRRIDPRAKLARYANSSLSMAVKNPIRFWSLTAFLVGQTIAVAENDSHKLMTGKAAMGDWTSDAPGVRRKITVADLPPPGSNVLAINSRRVMSR